MSKRPKKSSRADESGMWVHPRLSDLLHQRSLDEMGSVSAQNVRSDESRMVKLADELMSPKKKNKSKLA